MHQIFSSFPENQGLDGGGKSKNPLCGISFLKYLKVRIARNRGGIDIK